MLTKWGLTNFKSIYNACLELAPLTVLTGTNSSGKSSLIQSMLMVAQTMQSQFKDRSLILNGSLTELGKFDQVLSFDVKKNKNLGIIFHLKSKNALFNGLEFEAEFRPQGKSDAVHPDSFSPVLLKTNQSIVTTDNENLDISTELRKNRMLVTRIADFLKNQLKESYKKMLLDFIRPYLDSHLGPADADIRNQIDDLLNETGNSGRSKNGGVADNLKNDLANRLAQAFNSKELLDTVLLSSLPHDFMSGFDNMIEKNIWMSQNHFVADKFIVPFVNKTKDEAKLTSTKQAFRDREINIAQISLASETLVDYFTHSFKYLGPLRFRKKLSPFSKAGDKRDVGITGEFTAAVYDAFKNEIIKYIAPAVFENVQPKEKNGVVSTNTFSRALNEWLRYLGVSNGVDVEAEENGYKIKINSSDKHPVDMTHVGTGVSQVLPILVSCLITEPGSTLVFEQPELHLHPRVQSRLADFFLSMALLGKQCIIETHSEYIIDKLRLRIVQAPGETLVNTAAIYFAEKKTAIRNSAKSALTNIRSWKTGRTAFLRNQCR